MAAIKLELEINGTLNVYEYPEGSIGNTILSLLTMDGRIDRLTYFKYSFIVNLIGLPISFVFVVIVLALSMLLGIVIDPEITWDDFEVGGFVGIGIILALCIILPFNVCLGVRRLQDLNRSKWLMLMHFIPYIGPIVLGMYLLFFKGTDGPNQYGPDPLQSRDDTIE